MGRYFYTDEEKTFVKLRKEAGDTNEIISNKLFKANRTDIGIKKLCQRNNWKSIVYFTLEVKEHIKSGNTETFKLTEEIVNNIVENI